MIITRNKSNKNTLFFTIPYIGKEKKAIITNL